VTEPLPRPWTVEDLLEWEAQQSERYEFIDGRILGAVGGSAAHAAIKDNVTSALNVRLRGGPRTQRRAKDRDARRQPLSGRRGHL
jgi:hypothetical protein